MKLLPASAKVLLLCVVVGVLVLGPSARAYGRDQRVASPVLAPNLRSLVAQADGIVVGRTVAISRHLVFSNFSALYPYASGAQIQIKVTFEVQETLTGSLRPGQVLIFEDLVGVETQEMQKMGRSGAPFRENEASLLFLANGAPTAALLHGDLGKFDIDDEGFIPRLGQTLTAVKAQILSYSDESHGSQGHVLVFLPFIH